ncbi:MAG: lipoprotein signal peptidase [Chitinophagaceae bacterium]|nr:lipoprotein signal peptidase [Chitinophagaceae bacterium]
MNYLKYYLVSFAVIIVDQAIKLYVHFFIPLGSAGEISVIGDFLKIHYLTNPGMAFGMKFDLVYGKFILSFIRLGAMFVISYYLYLFIKNKFTPLFLYSCSLILGGAIGNLIDSIFYGVLLHNAPYDSITPWFHGQVIDMIYFDIWEGYVPEWIPYFGENYLSLWPVFNIADASIFTGVCIILLFQNTFFKNKSFFKDVQKDKTNEL